ncbi:MAG: glycosyltransferase family 4 protein [bacterium]|nr:glycosyltransferase family 4 protein [bacterium]
MRLAFIDLMFSWPPNGGADVDLYQTARHFQNAGNDVHVFVTGLEGSWARGDFRADDLPFPATRLPFSFHSMTRRNVVRRLRDAVTGFRPDVVYVCDGFFMKPHVTLAFADYPTVSRFYAYEMACGPTPEMHATTGAAPPVYLREPRRCRRETLRHLRGEIVNWQMGFWCHEYMMAGAFMPGYGKTLAKSYASLDAALVYNGIMAGHVRGWVDDVRIVPGGVEMSEYTHAPAAPKGEGDCKVILMTGRVEDPVKGFDTLLAAGDRLAATRNDFEVRITDTECAATRPWLKVLGRFRQDEMQNVYRQADVCVVPSVWEEPFGLVAVEAMAVGRPVCASRVGGLQHIVRHDETGFLFDRGDAAGLASCLERLLDDAALRERMGTTAREVAEDEYDWARIVERHHLPLLEGLAQ